MAPSPLSIAANVFGVIPIAFGINAILRPAHALTFFEFPPPTTAADAALVNALTAIYGVRDIFMGLAIYATAWFGSARALGWILVAVGGVGVADGVVCLQMGGGEWNHWGYAPVVMGIGALILRSAKGR